ncbi:MAG: HEAT repeat protein [Planctomycetota bacterium]|jgi:HEAT repeat protein
MKPLLIACVSQAMLRSLFFGLSLGCVMSAMSTVARGNSPMAIPTLDDVLGGENAVALALLHSRADGKSSKVLVPRLAQLAQESVEAICKPMLAGRFEMRVGAGEVVLRDLQAHDRAALMTALGAAELGDLRAYFTALAESGVTLSERIGVLEILGVHGNREDMTLLLHWAAGYKFQGRIKRGLREAYGTAVALILERDPKAISLARRIYSDLPLALKPALIRALGRTESMESLATLTGFLGRNSQMDALILRELAVLGGQLKHPLDVKAQWRIAKTLHSPARAIRQQCIEACKSMETTQAVPALIALMSSEDAFESEQALKALEFITGQRLSRDEKEWTDWLEGAHIWWESEAQDLIHQVRTGTPAEVNQALVKLSRERYFRHRLVTPVAVGLENEEESIVRVACAALGYMGSPLGVEPLLDRLARASKQPIHQAALQALLQITGQNHGANPEAWHKAGW